MNRERYIAGEFEPGNNYEAQSGYKVYASDDWARADAAGCKIYKCIVLDSDFAPVRGPFQAASKVYIVEQLPIPTSEGYAAMLEGLKAAGGNAAVHLVNDMYCNMDPVSLLAVDSHSGYENLDFWRRELRNVQMTDNWRYLQVGLMDEPPEALRVLRRHTGLGVCDLFERPWHLVSGYMVLSSRKIGLFHVNDYVVLGGWNKSKIRFTFYRTLGDLDDAGVLKDPADTVAEVVAADVDSVDTDCLTAARVYVHKLLPKRLVEFMKLPKED